MKQFLPSFFLSFHIFIRLLVSCAVWQMLAQLDFSFSKKKCLKKKNFKKKKCFKKISSFHFRLKEARGKNSLEAKFHFSTFTKFFFHSQRRLLRLRAILDFYLNEFLKSPMVFKRDFLNGC